LQNYVDLSEFMNFMKAIAFFKTYLDFFAQHKLYEFGKCGSQLRYDIHDLALRLVSADSQLEPITTLHK
jgi:hypothetical protein